MVIEEFPVELLEPHVSELKQIKRFSRLANRLEVQLVRNTSEELPAGQKEFQELQEVLREIQSMASHPKGCERSWFWWLYLLIGVSLGLYGVSAVHLPLPKGGTTPSDEQSATSVEPIKAKKLNRKRD